MRSQQPIDRASRAVAPAGFPPLTSSIAVMRDALLGWYSQRGRVLPWRQSDRTAWEVLLAEVLLARTGALRVREMYGQLVQFLPDPKAVVALGEVELERLFRAYGLGLHRQRARLLYSLAQAILERHGGQVPVDIGALQVLPGVGDYVAHAVAAFAWDMQVPIVDTNVARVFSRYFDLPPVKADRRPPRTYWELAKSCLPPGQARVFNQALLDLAALVCRPSRPMCMTCPLSDACRHADALTNECGVD